MTMTERDIIFALAWIVGVGAGALGVILWALARWIVGHVEGLRTLIDKEMRAFDVRLAQLETETGMRRGERYRELDDHRRPGED